MTTELKFPIVRPEGRIFQVTSFCTQNALTKQSNNMKMRHKFIIIALLSLLKASSVFGQSSSGIQWIDDYFKGQDLTTIDPIEGYYRGELITDISAPAYGLHRSNNDEIEGVIRKENGILKFDFSWGEGSLTRIGESNAYNYRFTVTLIGGKKNTSGMLTLNNGSWSFKEYEQYAREGVNRQYSYTFIKSYPTSSMYAEAYQRKQQAQIKKEVPQNWSGTGFALKNGYIITNYHVIEDASTINIYGVGGNFNSGIKASVVGSDKYNDLALLKLSGTIPSDFNSIPYGFKSKIADVGEDVYVLGYPLTATMGEEVKLTNGIISARTGYDGDVTQYQISVPVQPGNSGGPLIDYKGNVIGVICAKHREAENASYAIKTSQLRNLIESVSDLSIMNTTNTLQGKSLKDQVKSVNKYVYIIKCSK